MINILGLIWGFTTLSEEKYLLITKGTVLAVTLSLPPVSKFNPDRLRRIDLDNIVYLFTQDQQRVLEFFKFYLNWCLLTTDEPIDLIKILTLLVMHKLSWVSQLRSNDENTFCLNGSQVSVRLSWAEQSSNLIFFFAWAHHSEWLWIFINHD